MGREIGPLESTHFILLLETGEFEEAKIFADRLIEAGVPQSDINFTGYQVFQKYLNPAFKDCPKRSVRELVRVFREYSWDKWM